MSSAPEVRAVLQHRMESMRAAQQGIDDLISAAMEDRSPGSSTATTVSAP